MTTPKKFIQQAVEMETFFEDEEPTFDEFMKYPPFNTLMSNYFSIPSMIELYRDGNLIFVDCQEYFGLGTRHSRVNFFTKHREDVLFHVVNYDKVKFDEIDPVSMNKMHDILMKVEWNDYTTKDNLPQVKRTQFLNLTTEEESYFANFLNRILGNVCNNELFPDGKQYLYAEYRPMNYVLYTTSYLKIFQPFNTVFPSWVVKRLTTLFESTKV
tara:strand:- start:1290 stop:1928 length:639 start_codon:yes stop_codon:yes gene_type:complete